MERGEIVSHALELLGLLRPLFLGGHTTFFESSEAVPSRFFWNRSVPRHGAKNILPVKERCTVLTATTSHMMTHNPVNT
jgi:hypothetical protein